MKSISTTSLINLIICHPFIYWGAKGLMKPVNVRRTHLEGNALLLSSVRSSVSSCVSQAEGKG